MRGMTVTIGCRVWLNSSGVSHHILSFNKSLDCKALSFFKSIRVPCMIVCEKIAFRKVILLY